MRRTLASLMVAATLALVVASPGPGVARGAATAQSTPGPTCVPNQADGSCLPLAPESARVDLATPVFSDPTTITNPLFPIGELHSVVQMGTVDGLPFRVEVTVLPESRIINWNGQRIETLISQ